MERADRKFWKATDLARICDVDLKTIHNWEIAGKIKGFRTPGRHLRFLPAEVAAFLKKHGFPVPEELNERPRTH